MISQHSNQNRIGVAEGKCTENNEEMQQGNLITLSVEQFLCTLVNEFKHEEKLSTTEESPSLSSARQHKTSNQSKICTWKDVYFGWNERAEGRYCPTPILHILLMPFLRVMMFTMPQLLSIWKKIMNCKQKW